MWGRAPGGSRSGFFVRSQAVRGQEEDDPVTAFDEIAVEFLGDHYWDFFDVAIDDATSPSELKANAEDVNGFIQAHWDALGLGRRPVFVLHHLQLPAARAASAAVANSGDAAQWVASAVHALAGSAAGKAACSAAGVPRISSPRSMSWLPSLVASRLLPITESRSGISLPWA
jgi:hypothetical protein